MDDESIDIASTSITGLFGVFAVVAAMLLTSDYLTSVSMRFLCATSFYGRAAIQRPDPLFFIITITICFVLIEIISYVNHKEKAQLFLKIKQTAFQQEQIQNLLNTVPDSVLISSLATESKAPLTIYSNRQMNNFFGCDTIFKDRMSKNRPLQRRIFKENSLIDDQQCQSNIFEENLPMSMSMSLSSILLRHRYLQEQSKNQGYKTTLCFQVKSQNRYAESGAS